MLPSGHAVRKTRAGFTLVELIVAVGLLLLIMVAVAFVFGTSGSAMSEAQAATEMAHRLAAFDMKNIEHRGLMGMGGRVRQAYGNQAQKDRERLRDFRIDWLMFFTNCQQDVALDENTTGQWSRVFYGHSRASDPDGWGFRDQTSSMPLTPGMHSNFSDLASDWLLMRHQVMVIHALRPGQSSVTCDVAGSVTQYGTGAQYQRNLEQHPNRDMRWMSWHNSQWQGSATVPYGPLGSTGTGRLAIYEPLYYHYGSIYNTDQRSFRALAHCANFRVQYARADDLRAGPGGSINWNDPPMYERTDTGSESPISPNPDYGRLIFRPNESWPVMLRVTVEIFDPFSRIDSGRSFTGIYRVP